MVIKNISNYKLTILALLLTSFFLLQLSPIYAEMICKSCKTPITGTYWEVQGQIYCNSCYQKIAMKCERCGKIIDGPYITLEGLTYCESCYEQVASRCEICNEIISGEYILSADGKRAFCMNCASAYPACKNCGVPTGRSGVTLPDGRILCSDCFVVAIYTDEDMENLFEQVKIEMSASLGMEVDFPVGKINLVDRKRLNEIYSNQTVEYAPKDGVSGLHYYEKINGRLTKSEIYILNYLTPERAWGVLSHEYTHAWQAENCPDWQDLKIREGLAEWVSYKILNSKGFSTSGKIDSEDPIYGGGLRQMLEIEEREGLSGVINYAKSSPGDDSKEIDVGFTFQEITDISDSGENFSVPASIVSQANSPVFLFVVVFIIVFLLLITVTSFSRRYHRKKLHVEDLNLDESNGSENLSF